MSSLILELVTPPEERYIELSVVNHVHSRIETFVYQDAIVESSVALDYVDSIELNSRKNLSLIDRSYQVKANAGRKIDPRAGFNKTVSSSYSTAYSNVLVTNKTFTDENNKVRPLFYKHVLQALCTDVKLEIIRHGNLSAVDTGYVIDLTAGLFYTNYQNYFDNKGNYIVYFLTSTIDGVQVKELLNPIPVVDEATWEDIDPDTGTFYTDRRVYTIEKNTSGYTYYFSKSDEYWIKPIEVSLLKARYPIGITSDEAWYIRVTNGDVSSGSYRYWLPEFSRQPYQPSAPYIFTPYNKLTFVGRRLLGATRGNLAIHPDEGLHVSIYIYDSGDNLIKVWTSDISINGSRYSNTNIFYEYKIDCWDNKSGLISVTEPILDSWNYYGTFYYEADDLEHTAYDFNPVRNKDILNQSIVFYVIPNCDEDDTGLHYLILNKMGRIIYTSQSQGFTYPCLQAFDEEVPNPLSIIGMKYSSSTDDSFLSLYSAGAENEYQYLTLAEVNLIDNTIIADVDVIDVRQEGDQLDPDAFGKNPKALHSIYGYGEDGVMVPMNNVILIDADLSLLTDYGGALQQAEAEELLTRHLPIGCFSIVDWSYPYSEVSVDVQVVAEVTVTWTWEGDFTYRLYRKTEVDWELVDEFTSATDITFSHTESVDSSTLVSYEVRIFDTYEYPSPYSITAKVR